MKRIEKQALVKAELLHLAETQGGAVSPRSVVEVARDPANILHGFFEWDDARAGEAFRLVQAQGLIRSVKIRVVVESKEPTRVNIVVQRAFPSLPSLRGAKSGSYVPIETIADPSELVNEVLTQLQSLRKKHSALKQLSGVWRAVDEATA